MDLDQFKTAWRANELLQSQSKELDMKQIEQLIQKKVGAVVSQQRTHFFWSMIRMLVIPAIILIGFFTMSDGFSDPNDPIGALAVMLAIPLALFFYFGQRYLATRSLAESMTSTTRETLSKVQRLLRRNQLAELGLLGLFTLLLLGGAGFLLADEINISLLPPLLLPLILIGFVAYRIWSGYRDKQSELDALTEQLQ